MPFGECCLNVGFSSCTIRDEALCVSPPPCESSVRLNSVKMYIQPLPKIFILNLHCRILDCILYQLRLVWEYYALSI